MTISHARLRPTVLVRAPLLVGCAVLLSACGPEGAGTVDMSKAKQAKAAPAPTPAPAPAPVAKTKASPKAPANPGERLGPPGPRSGRPG
jgi:hypothetical protein